MVLILLIWRSGLCDAPYCHHATGLKRTALTFHTRAVRNQALTGMLGDGFRPEVSANAMQCPRLSVRGDRRAGTLCWCTARPT
eukprot:1993840-Rhodomonas_salina.1